MAKKPRGHKAKGDTASHCYAPSATHTSSNPKHPTAGKRHCYTTAPPREVKPTDTNQTGPHKLDGGKVWRTVRGHRVLLDPKKPLKDQIKDALGSKYVHKRLGAPRKDFAIFEKVLYDDLEKSGTVVGVSGRDVLIAGEDGAVLKYSNEVFRESDTFDFDRRHWDMVSDMEQAVILKTVGGLPHFVGEFWDNIPPATQSLILKYGSDAGATQYGGPVSTQTAGIYNPVYKPTTLNEIIERARRGNEKKD